MEKYDMQLDTSGKGLTAIFKKWQIPLVEELHNGLPKNSRESYEFLMEHDVKTQREIRTVSRASVINFLNYMVDQGLLDFTLRTGKGGHQRIYKMILTREEFAHTITDRFVNKLLETFPEESKTFPWPRP